MTKAKTVSKNNAALRTKDREYLFNNRVVKTVRYINDKSNFIAAAYADDGKLVKDKAGNVLAWAKISSAAPAA